MRLIALALCSAVVLYGQVEIYEGELNGQPIVYRIHEGRALYQGDIDLGPVTKPNGQRNTSFFIGNLWPEGRIPYEIDPALPATTVTQLQLAITTWNNYGTPIRLVPRAGDVDYTRFVYSPLSVGVCSSAVGRSGGMQTVTLEAACTAPPIIHEIGHTVGMWHEQQRIDRNFHVTVLYENIAKQFASNYTINSVSGQDLAGYEYSSSMQYRPFSFSVDGRLAIESVPPGIPMGEASGMNAGDLDAVNRKYGVVPAQTTIASNPPGLVIEVDGENVVTPRAFNWAVGSRHNIGAPAAAQAVGTLSYAFGKWSDGGTQTHSITTSGDVAVYTANFIRRFPVLVGTATGGTVSVSPTPGAVFYPAYTQITLTAQPAAGYKFSRWLGDCGATSANPLVLAPRAASTSCTPLFTQSALTTVTSDPPGRTVFVDGVSYVTPINLSYAAGVSRIVSASTPSAGSASRFLFSEWSDGGTPAHAYVAKAEGEVLTARFAKQYLLTLQQSSLARIIASPSSLDGFYDAGSVVSLSTSLTAPFLLFSWTGDMVGRSDPAALTMDDQKLVGVSLTTATASIVTLNALTYRAASIAPGQLISLFGTDLGPTTPVGPVIDATGRVATLAGGVRVLFDGIPGPILYASSGQLNTVVPYSVTGASTRITVEFQGTAKPAVTVPLVATNPSIVNNGGKAAVVNQDGSINTPDRPAKRGSVIVFFASGEGATSPAGVDGRVGVAPLAKPTRDVSVRIGGRVADLIYAGNAPNFVAGAMQVNARIPDDAPTGEVSLYLIVGTASNNAPVITLYVE